LAHPPQRVWQALDLFSAWFMPNDFEPAVCRAFTFRRPKPNTELHFSDTILCEVLEIQAGKLLSYSWTDRLTPASWTGRALGPWSLRAAAHACSLNIEAWPQTTRSTSRSATS
jgi:uncharacterized protein YndB with AHSA1/START domain